MRPRTRLGALPRLAPAVLVAASVTAFTVACSGGQSKTKSPSSPYHRGAKVFASAGCGSCHRLSAAGSTGLVGPDLDELKPDAAAIARQVRNGGNGMPSFSSRLGKQEIDDVAAFVAAASRRSERVPTFQPDSKTIAGCEKHSSPGCFRQAFGNVAYRSGPQKALDLLATDDQTVPGVHADCHQIAHTIGHGGLAHYSGNAAAALAHGAMTCNSGYYHGVIELAFAGVRPEKVIGIARTLCTEPSVTRDEFLLYQCVHGLGHGLMIYSGGNLPFALHACDKLQTAFSQVSCTGGVFMQLFLPESATSRFLKRSDLIYPCNDVATRYKLYCYLQATARIIEVIGPDWRKVAAWCHRSEPGWVATCFQSYGRDASGISEYQPRRTIRLCLLARNMAAECFYGASRDYANNYAGGEKAARLCVLAPKRYRARCFNGVGTILGALNRYGRQRRAACAAVTPPAYGRDCLRGAGVIE